MIRSFACRETEAIFHRERSKRLPQDLHRSALRKLRMLDAATRLEDLRIPPGNRLEKLSGRYEGFYSVRINDQWRICFRFEGDGPSEVQIRDYH